MWRDRGNSRAYLFDEDSVMVQLVDGGHQATQNTNGMQLKEGRERNNIASESFEIRTPPYNYNLGL